MPFKLTDGRQSKYNKEEGSSQLSARHTVPGWQTFVLSVSHCNFRKPQRRIGDTKKLHITLGHPSSTVMDGLRDSSPALAFEKDALELTVEDVYDISYVIGRDLLKISKAGAHVSDLQFRIVRVLEMFEVLVNKYNLSLEELKMERDNLKRELDRVVGEKSAEQGSVSNVTLFGVLDR